MKYCLILTATICMFAYIHAKVHFSDIQIFENHGPLYQAARFLILDEKQNANFVWNDLEQQIREQFQELNKTLVYLNKYKAIVNEKLYEMKALQHSENFKTCYKQHEKQIARFSRDFLQNYETCKELLNARRWQKKNEFVKNIEYIGKAAIEIQELKSACNVTDLQKNETVNHNANLVLCLLANLGEINQRMEASAHVITIILASLTFNLTEQESLDDDTLARVWARNNDACLDFQHSEDEFQIIYANVKMCVHEIY